MKSPKEIKTQMGKCFSALHCRETCPYFKEHGENFCLKKLMEDALEYIELLEERIAIMTETESEQH